MGRTGRMLWREKWRRRPAVTMVRELFASPGAAQESDIFAFASDVESDQRMEIDRMAAMLKELQK